MKQNLLICLMFITLLFLTACGNTTKTITCKMNSSGSMLPELVATLDPNNRISEIEIHNVYQDEDSAKKDFNNYITIHGNNAVLDKNVIIIKNAQDENTFSGKQFSKTVGYTVEEFQSFIGNYTCE